MSHFSKSISQTTTFWELGLGLFSIRIILRGKLVFYDSSMTVVRLWRNGLGEVGHNLSGAISIHAYIAYCVF